MTQADEQPFWTRLDRLVQESTVVVDRPRGARHPRFPELVYPMDYRYLAETRTTDDGGVDVWLGSLAEWRVTSVLITVEPLKRDVEIKLLVGCTPDEARLACAHASQPSQSALLVVRSP